MPKSWYELRIQGILSPENRDWFEDLEIRQEDGERMLLCGWMADQSALHGLLARVRDLNLTLLSVNPAEPPAAQREPKGE